MKIVVLAPQAAGHMESIHHAAPAADVVEVSDEVRLLEAVVDAEILLTGMFGDDLLDAAARLKWVQVSSAGIDLMPREAVAKKGWQVTNAAGIHAIPVAETAIALLSGLARRLNLTMRTQLQGEWNQPAAVYELFEKTIGVIAMGGIGRAMADRARGLGMRVIAVDVNPASKPDSVEELRGIDELGWMLGAADIVCMTAPDTPKSHHMMNAERFAQMKDGSIFINVSRGGLVDTDALMTVLDSGRFFGVGLDVIEGEPLKPDHPIWAHENVLITPHFGGKSPRRVERLIELFAENLRRYQAGQPLRNRVDLKAGF